MNESKFDNLWKMMSQYSFKTESTSVIDDLACFKCKKLMIDACQTACGCQYCYLCISDHVADDSTYCPGGRQECNEEYLVLERDVMRNMRMNNKIYKLSVYCPNESCLSLVELSRMEEHLRLCSKKDAPCPCAALGCDKPSSHDASPHTELLVGWITNLKNEIDGLKERLNGCELEMEFLRDESKMKDIQILDITEQREYYMGEMEAVKEESVEKEKRIKILENEFKDGRNEKNLGMMEINKQFDFFKKEAVKRIGKLEAAKNDFGKNSAAMTELKEEVGAIKAVLNCVIDENQNNTFSSAKSSHSYQSYDDGYTWKIDRISLIRGAIYSDNFYSKKYRFCLSALLKDDVLSIWCYIVRGNNDDSLQWPMMHAITIGVVNQKTLRVSKRKIFQYDSYNTNYLDAFDKPLGNRNEQHIGYNTFLDLSKHSGLASIVVSDSIVVSCVLSDP